MIKNYLKIAFKVLMRRKFFTFISLFGITFTLLIINTLVSFIDYSIGTVPPELNLNRTLNVMHISLSGPETGTMQGPLLSHYCMTKYIKSLKTPEKVSIISFFNNVIVYQDKKKLELAIRFTDAEFWEIMDFKFLEGKPFNAGDVKNVNRVAVINEDTRKKYFDGEPAVGKMIEADGRSFRVVGVVENVPILRIMPYSDIWVPITSSKDDIKAQTLLGGFPGYFALILAKDRSDFPAIKAELKKNIDQFDFMDNRYDKIVVNAETYPEFLSRVFRLAEESSMTALYLLVSILLIIFMLLPAVNLVNINVSRIIERTSEIGVRKAFGASSMTLVGQFIVENIILTLIGGVLGLIFTAVVLGIFNQAGLIEFAHFEINHRIFLISLFVCLFFGLFSGVYPAFRMSRLHPADALKGGGR